MQTHLRVLSEEERHQLHMHTLGILATTGVRVDTPRGRQILKAAGGEVNENTHIVRFPKTFVEEALKLAPKQFNLGARRPDWDLRMNTGTCTLLPDGEAVWTLDRKTGKQRPSTFQDWLDATLLTDAIDEVGLYWSMVAGGKSERSLPDLVNYWCSLFTHFSKHTQIEVEIESASPWLLEVLQVVFGDREAIRQKHPISFLLCPQSPLVIDQQHTDAYLELLGWDIPVAAMPMPLMGGTAPGTMISTVLEANCETLALLCLIQAAAPGTPFIYAPVPAAMNPRTGLYSGGAVANGLLGAAVTEMARYYELPVEASGGGSDFFNPGIQAGYESSLNVLLPVLSWPDILVGPGLLCSSMILSFEQFIIDIEVFRMCKHMRRGIPADEGQWLEDVITRVGPAGNYLGDRSTRRALRSGEWHIPALGVHDPQKVWQNAGGKTLLEQAREEVNEILSTHRPLPLSDNILKELERIQQKAKMSLTA